MMETKTVWQLTNVSTVKATTRGMIVLDLSSEGNDYIVTCEAPINVSAQQLVTAFRAAAAQLILAAGGDMSAVGAQTLEEAAMDTDGQRAN